MNIRTCAGSMRVCAVALLAACGDSGSGTEPPPPPPPPPAPALRFVSGATGSDTIDTELAQALVVEVTGDDGKPQPGVAVRFTALPPSDPERRFEQAVLLATELSNRFADFVADTTDDSGRIGVVVQLGRVAGDAMVVVSVPALALSDTARFVVLPGHPSGFHLASIDLSVVIGGQIQLDGAVVDRYGNARSDAVTYATLDAACDVTPSGLVRGLTMGSCALTARVGEFTESARVSVVPDWELIAVEYDPQRVVKFRLGSSVRTPIWENVSGEAMPDASPDGHVVLRRDDHLVLISPTGAGVEPFPLSPPAPWQGWARFSFDNQWVYFAGGAGIYRVRVDGAALEPVFLDWTATTPDPSPDGKRVVFARNEQPMILDLSSGSLISPAIPGTLPRWSPDGKRIAFISDGRVMVMNADGTNPVQVSRPEVLFFNNSGLDWSADGEWLVAYSVRLEIIKADGSDGLSVSLPGLSQFTFVR